MQLCSIILINCSSAGSIRKLNPGFSYAKLHLLIMVFKVKAARRWNFLPLDQCLKLIVYRQQLV